MTWRWSLLSGWLVLASGLAGACGVESPAAMDIVARYGANGEELTCRELDGTLQRVALESGSGTEPKAPDAAKLVQKFLLVRSLATSAEDLGLAGDPAIVERWTAARDALLVHAAEMHVAANVQVTSEDVDDYLRLHPDTASRPEMLSASLLLLSAPPDASEERLEELEEELLRIRAEYVGGTPFGELARRYSEAENAFRGGVLPIAARGELPAEFESIAWELDPGAVSPPTRLSSGVALIRADRRLPPHQATPEEARIVAERRVRAEKLAAARGEALEDARRRWPARVDWAAISDPSLPPDTVVAHLGEEALTLDSMGLAHRPPRLRREVERGLERSWLRRLAEDVWRLPAEPEIAARIRSRHVELLATARIEHELREAVASGRLALAPGPAQGRERRSFRVLLAPGEEGSMRPAFALVERARETWLETGEPPTDGVEIEYWGPITRRQLADATTPQLAKLAFELEPGVPSPAIRLETTASARGLTLETVGAVSIESVSLPDWAERFFESAGETTMGGPLRERAAIVWELERRHAEALAPVEIDAAAWHRCVSRIVSSMPRSG